MRVPLERKVLNENDRIAATLRDRLAVHAVTVACHWLGSSADHVLTGDRVHEVLANGFGDPKDGGRADDFRIDLWTRPS